MPAAWELVSGEDPYPGMMAVGIILQVRGHAFWGCPRLFGGCARHLQALWVWVGAKGGQQGIERWLLGPALAGSLAYPPRLGAGKWLAALHINILYHQWAGPA